MIPPPPKKKFRSPTHSELERLYETQRLVNRTSNRQIVHGDLPQDALGIDQITRAKGYPFVLDQTSIVACDAHVPVCQKRDAKIGSETSCVAGLFRPCIVRVFRVGGDGCSVPPPPPQVASRQLVSVKSRSHAWRLCARTEHCSVERRKVGKRVVER
jgi:hypothetical protein